MNLKHKKDEKMHKIILKSNYSKLVINRILKASSGKRICYTWQRKGKNNSSFPRSNEIGREWTSTFEVLENIFQNHRLKLGQSRILY